MILYILLILKYLCFTNTKIIKNGVYSLVTNDLHLFYYKRYLSLSDDFKYPNCFFRIKKITKEFNITLYNIEELLKHYKLSFLNNKELKFNKYNDDLQLWNFIKLNDKNIIIQNKNSCYITVKSLKFFCENIPLKKATHFELIKIFSEVDNHKSSNYFETINDEPIDILIKYIDLNDPNLKRNGIHQIEKDYDNEELRYSVRSIFNNIPWVRKIFILMPNEKVRYFKKYNLINEKIIYIKDKDLIGFDSSSSLVFQFRYWKMKDFNMSDNFICMDDDYYIGRPLKKMKVQL